MKRTACDNNLILTILNLSHNPDLRDYMFDGNSRPFRSFILLLPWRDYAAGSYDQQN
jgi:hypothetical protein